MPMWQSAQVANFAAKMLSKATAGQIVLGASARAELPGEWQESYTDLITNETGWTYIQSGLPYPLYRYHGRWARSF